MFFFGGIAIVAIAAAVAFNVNLNTNKSDKASILALANVEALAQEEGVTITCDADGLGQNAQCWSTRWSYQNMDACCYFTGIMEVTVQPIKDVNLKNQASLINNYEACILKKKYENFQVNYFRNTYLFHQF